MATGGNLFGLWKNLGSAVIHVVLVPGQRCRRTSASFQQDARYFERLHRFLDDRYSLCHIGEWRSHHNLISNKPSPEEEQHIQRIFPQGVSKFLVIIANIKNGDTIVLSPYFFTDGGQRYEKAEYVVLESNSAFSTDVTILAEIENGVEAIEYDREIVAGNQQNTGLNPCQDGGNTNSGNRYANPEPVVLDTESPFSSVSAGKYTRVSSKSAGNQGSSWNDNTSSICCHQADPNSFLFGQTTSAPKPNPRPSDALVDLTAWPNPSSYASVVNQSKRNSRTGNLPSNTRILRGTPPLTVNPNHMVKPRPPDTSGGPSTPGSQAKPTQNDPVVEMDTDDSDVYYPRRVYEKSSSSHPPKSQHDTSAEGQGDPEKKMNVGGETPSEREVILKKIHDHLKYRFGGQPESMFKLETSKNSRDIIEISFKHNRNFWLVRFPVDFPGKTAELFCSNCSESLHYSKVFRNDIVEPLNNDVNILLSMKNRCSGGDYDVCKHFTKESLSQYDFSPVLREKLQAAVSKLEDDITRNLSGVNDLKSKCLDSLGEITFKHGGKFWIINITAFFPDVPANVYYLYHEKSYQKHEALLPGHSNEPHGINSSKMIIKTIHMSCRCTPCMNARPQYY